MVAKLEPDKAQQSGQNLPEQSTAVSYVEAEEDTEALQESAYDLFEGLIGLFHSSGGGNWSENCGEKFAEGMAEKRRQGHL